MKIKILKDIPGYKAGDILGGISLDSSAVFSRQYALKKSTPSKTVFINYPISVLLEEGFVEEVKEIDMEGIKNKILHQEYVGHGQQFLIAYMTVKAVIEKLNDGWEIDWQSIPRDGDCYIFSYDHSSKEVLARWFNQPFQTSFLPYPKSKEIAEKVIELCGPELETLFGIKKS